MHVPASDEQRLHPALRTVQRVYSDGAVLLRPLDDGTGQQRDAHLRRNAANDAVERAELQPGGARPTEFRQDLFEPLSVGTTSAEREGGRTGSGGAAAQGGKAGPTHRRDQHELLLECGHDGEVGMVDRATHEGTVERPVKDCTDERGCRAGAKRQLYRRPGSMEA